MSSIARSAGSAGAMVQEDPAQVVEAGKWEGKYIDVRGFEGKVTLNLKGAGGKLTGTFKLVILDEESSEEITGTLTGMVEKETVFLTPLPEGAKQSIKLKARLAAAKPHALQALYGNVPAQPGTRFGGGVWMLWKFIG